MVETETNRLQQLENESSNLQQRIKNQQDLLGGIGLTQIEQQTHGYIKILENRLQNVCLELGLLDCCPIEQKGMCECETVDSCYSCTS